MLEDRIPSSGCSGLSFFSLVKKVSGAVPHREDPRASCASAQPLASQHPWHRESGTLWVLLYPQALLKTLSA